MSVYLDANVLVSAFHRDIHSDAAYRIIGRPSGPLIVSDVASAEFVAVLGRLTRMRRLAEIDARNAISDLDFWLSAAPRRVVSEAADVAQADRYLRRLDLNLRLPDAQHIAIAQRLGAHLATFDVRMAEAAQTLGVPVLSDA